MLSVSIWLSSLWLPSLWGQEKASREKIYCPFPSNQDWAVILTKIHTSPEETMQKGAEKANTGEKPMCISFYGSSGRLLVWKACPFGHLHRLKSVVWWWHLPCVPFFITISSCPFWGHSNLSPLFLGRPSPLAFVPWRERMVLPTLPLSLMCTAGMDPARGGLVSWDLEKLRCVSAFKMTSF